MSQIPANPLRFGGLQIQRFHPSPELRRGDELVVKHAVHVTLTPDDHVTFRDGHTDVEFDPPVSVIRDSKALYEELQANSPDLNIAKAYTDLTKTIQDTIDNASALSEKVRNGLKQNFTQTLKASAEVAQFEHQNALTEQLQIPQKLAAMVEKLPIDNQQSKALVVDAVRNADSYQHQATCDGLELRFDKETPNNGYFEEETVQFLKDHRNFMRSHPPM
jgi:hypothetical protein